MASSSTHKAELENLQRLRDVNIMFYNPGIVKSQVHTAKLYKKWILDKLRKDVVQAILVYKADIIALSELGEVNIGLGRFLSTWKESKKQVRKDHSHLVEDMLMELVDAKEVHARNPAGFSAHAIGNYGLLVATDRIRILDAPTLVGPLCTIQTYRHAQRFTFMPVTSSDENPAKPIELWNLHCPASKNYPYGPLAREQVCQFCQKHAGQRVIWGGDLNQSHSALETFKAEYKPWKVHEPGNAKHGDIALTRGVCVDLMHCCIGKDEAMGTSDAHVMVGLVLHAEQDSRAAKLAKSALKPLLLANHETQDKQEVRRNVEKPEKFTLRPNSEALEEEEHHASNVVSVDDDEGENSEQEPLADWGEADDITDAHSIITELSNALDNEEGPPEHSDDIKQLIRVLWFGPEFQQARADAYERGQARLANILSHVRWVRWKYGGISRDVNPANAILSSNQIKTIHNQYRDSCAWMPEDVWKKYKDFRDNSQQGSNQAAYQHCRKTFNVFLFKMIGCKALFFYLVKVGPENTNMGALLQEWLNVKASDEYKKMLSCSAAKSDEEKELKAKRDRIRCELKKVQERVNKRARPEDIEGMNELLRQLKDAKRAFQETGRSGSSSGVAYYLADS